MLPRFRDKFVHFLRMNECLGRRTQIVILNFRANFPQINPLHDQIKLFSKQRKKQHFVSYLIYLKKMAGRQDVTTIFLGIVFFETDKN